MPERALSHTAPAAAGGLDSGSELSELTEEEQDGDNRSNDDDDPDDDDNDPDNALEGTRRRPVRGGGRRKRGGMVPAPMWDWAYKSKKSGERIATQSGEPEEEEEEPTPAERMEEEEDDEDEQAPRQTSGRPINRRNGAGEHEDQEAKPDWEGPIDDEVDRSFFDALSPNTQSKRTSTNRRVEPFSRGSTTHTRHSTSAANTNGNENETDEDDEDVDDDDDDADVEEEDGDVPQLSLDADADLGVESEGESDADIDATPGETPAIIPKALAPMDIDVDEPVDVTAPSPSAIAPMVALAAQASIMAGSSILASPTPSSNSSLSGTPASSRSASPTLERADEDAAPLPSPKRASKPEATNINQLPASASTAPAPKDKLAILAKIGDAEADTEAASVAPDELDLELEVEMDADMQPAHRAEALDVLASIELKFALLRERVYVEKMEGIAWEETLIAEGAQSLRSYCLFAFACLL